jgi:hypothetical protein
MSPRRDAAAEAADERAMRAGLDVTEPVRARRPGGRRRLTAIAPAGPDGRSTVRIMKIDQGNRPMP